MKPSAIWREATRNVASGTSRALLFGAILGVTVISLLLADASVVTSLIHQAIRFQTSGASVVILSSEGSVNGRACEALNEVNGVRAAGAIRASGETLITDVMPSSPIPTWSVSPSFPTIFGVLPDDRGGGVLLGSEAANLLGVAPGSPLAANGTQVRVAGVYDSPSDGRRAGYAYAALITETPVKPYDECWMDVWPAFASSTELLLNTVIPSSGPEKTTPSLGQLNTTLGARFDPVAAYMNRVTAPAAPIVAVLALVMGFASVRSRRVQLASALHAGVSPRALAAMVLIEAAFWAVPVVLCAIAACLIAVSSVPSIDRSALFDSALVYNVIALFSVASGVTLGIATIRERHLFAYFKDR